MKYDRKSANKSIFLFGGFLGVLVLGLMLGAIYIKKAPPEKSPNLLAMPENMDMVLKHIRHEAVRNGILEWTLDSESAQFVEKGQKAIVEFNLFTLISSDKSKTRVSAKRGEINILTNDFNLEGQVRVTSRGYILETDKLSYSNSQKIIQIPTPVKASGPSVTISADLASYDLNTKTTVFDGNVKATFRRQ